MAVGRRRGETQLARHHRAVQRKRGAGHRAGAQRAVVQPRCAIAQPVDVAEEHLAVGQQPVRHQNGLGALQVGVGGHGRLAACRAWSSNAALSSSSARSQLPAGVAHEQPQVGGDLLVAAAPGVQLEARFRRSPRQLLSFPRSDERLRRFRGRAPVPGPLGSVLGGNRVQHRAQLRRLTFGEDLCGNQRGRVALLAATS